MSRPKKMEPKRETVEILTEQHPETGLLWNEKFAARTACERAEGCLADALLVARERERHGQAVLINAALENLRVIKKIYHIELEEAQ